MAGVYLKSKPKATSSKMAASPMHNEDGTGEYLLKQALPMAVREY